MRLPASGPSCRVLPIYRCPGAEPARHRPVLVGRVLPTDAEVRTEERRPQFEFLLDDTGQPSYTFPDPIRLGEAVGQSEVLGTLAVGVETDTRNVGDPGMHGPRLHGLGIQAVRQGDPDVEAALGSGPGHAGGHQRGQSVQRRVPTFAVELTEHFDLLEPRLTVQVLPDHELGQRRRAEDLRLAGQDELVAHGVWCAHPPHPQTGGERLGERPEVDHPVGAAGAQRRQRVTVEAEQPVGVVLDHQQVVRLRQRQHPLAPHLAERHAGRIVEVRDGVEELRPATPCRQLRQDGGQGVGHETCPVHRDVHDPGLGGLERTEGSHVGRGLGEYDVTGVEEDPGQQIKPLLRADGDDHLVGGGVGDSLEGHHRQDLLAQPGVALAGAVLQRLRAQPADQLTDHRAHGVQRQGGHGRHSAGQRHHLGPADHREQCPNLRGRHAMGALGVAVGERIEVVAAHAAPPCGVRFWVGTRV